MSENINYEFPVTVYGNLEKYNETISKGRCRICYKYGNRNGTYITDEFAEKLVATLPYAPVKGIYQNEEGDYTDHGTARSQGRIYGVVPENCNFAWEEHLDEDGVARSYACVDVLIFTGLYTEANTIVGKSLSMELYPPSLKGQWQFINGKRYFVFEEGCFLGLQVLGDSVEPCFEGAAFFSLYNDLKKIVAEIEKYNLSTHNGGIKMLNFKLSDREKFDILFNLLNPNCNEENGWVVDYGICDVYDGYVLVRNYAAGCYERVSYTKDDATDSVQIGEHEKCYFMDVSEAEKTALDALRALNNNTYEKIDEVFQANKQELDAKIEENASLSETYEAEKNNFETKIGELNDSVATLTTERDSAVAQYQAELNKVTALTTENEALNSFKTRIEHEQKIAVVEKYTALLSEDVISKYKLEDYTAQQLDKEFAYELVCSNQSVFTNNGQNGYIPKNPSPVGGLEEILDKYKKK